MPRPEPNNRGAGQVVLDLVERLASRPITDAAETEHALDVHLTRDAAASTEYSDWFEGELGGPVTRVIWRAPAGPQAVGTCLLELHLARVCIEERDVTERFGLDLADLSIPPDAPADAPFYFVYRRPCGTVHFGFAREKPRCLQSVVLHFESESQGSVG